MKRLLSNKQLISYSPHVSVKLCFGSEAPKGLESSWISTSGKKPFPVVRMYGGEKAFWNKSWEMPDVELLK